MSNPYFYPGTQILRNKLELRDAALLLAAETRIVSAAIGLLKLKPLRGPYDAKRLKATHKAIFGELYPFAGKYRENMPRMSKQRDDGTVISYGPSQNVPGFVEDILNRLAAESFLKEFSRERFGVRGAYFYSELDAAHPFPEGNSRTLRLFMQDLAADAGHTLEWELVSGNDEQRQAFYRARDRAIRSDTSELEQIFRTALRVG